MNFLQNIDLNGNQLQNFLLHPSGTAPASPNTGMIYFDANTSVLRPKIYAGSAWKGLAYEADLTSYAKLADFNALQEKVNAFLDGDVDADGVLENLKEIQSFLDTYDGTTTLSDALNAINADITTLKGYFTNGAANKAVADANGNVITATYATQANVTSLTDALSTRIAKFEDMFEWDGDTIKAKASFYSVGQIAAGGAGEEGDGSTGSVILDFDSIVDALGYTPADADDLTSAVGRIAALEGKATAVSFAQTVTAGTALGTITIDGSPTVIYAPTIPTSLKNPNALTFGSKTYDGSAAVTLTASDLGALTSHQTIYALTVKNSAGTTVLTYTPNSAKGELTLTKAMVGLGNVENTALSTWTGSSKITTLGTITSGTWNGTAIANAYLANSTVNIAGTSASLGGSITAATLLANLGLTAAAKKYSAAITAGTATEYTITHSLGTRDVVVQVYDPSTYEQVMVDVVMTTTAAVKIVFASAPSKNYKVVVVG